jgi:hypothetical protein
VIALSGCDHVAFHPGTLSVIEALQQDPDLRGNKTLVIHSSIEEYTQAVAEELRVMISEGGVKPIPIFKGELRKSVDHLSHILSHMTKQKQANWRCLTLLEKVRVVLSAPLTSVGSSCTYSFFIHPHSTPSLCVLCSG